MITPTSQPASAPSYPVTSPPRRAAAQENDRQLSPSPALNPPPAPTYPKPAPASLYAGPTAGMATWTGKLNKNDTLTITGGMPSTGSVSGAGFPGVPVRVIVDQTNLGISELPNAANGYRRLVLRSHSKHDKITIHWTVVGQ